MYVLLLLSDGDFKGFTAWITMQMHKAIIMMPKKFHSAYMQVETNVYIWHESGIYTLWIQGGT